MDYASLADEIASWLQAHMREAGATRLVLGLSGGIDSAVVCALCTMAAGPSQVIAAIMPINSNQHDQRDAEDVARHYEVTPHVIDLAPAYDALLAALPDEDAMGLSDPDGNDERRRALALSNLKPRLRMTTLYALANRHNGVVVGTGNKTELSIGYFTKYGDGGVDLLPIGDLDKTTVRALARELDVPPQIIARAPSAGLWDGQTDESEIGLTYEQLDRSLAALASGEAASLAPGVRDRVAHLVQVSEHKRRPVPVFHLEEVS
ncbi:MAG: NAD(+) synthase [Thermomicrobiales bacterium]